MTDQNISVLGSLLIQQTNRERQLMLPGVDADLVAAFGWPRETIDATIETLRRDGEIFGSEKTGWRYDE